LTPRAASDRLKRLINYSDPLDGVFKALGDGARRRIVDLLARREATLSALAAALEISLPAVHQHVALLEEVGLVACEKRGRARFCRLDTRGLDRAEAWITGRRRLWEGRLAALERHLAESKRSRR
jgi:DNA-binding transcriptional ArsR family regulator